MGYYYEAEYSFTYNLTNLVALALDKDNLDSMIKNDRSAWTINYAEIETYSEGDIIESIVEYLGWDEGERVSDSDPLHLNRTGSSTKVKYNSVLSVLMNWLAMSGVKINVACRGEDQEYWRYGNPLDESNFSEENLVAISAKDYANYTKAMQMLRELSALTENDEVTTVAAAVVSEEQIIESQRVKAKIMKELAALIK